MVHGKMVFSYMGFAYTLITANKLVKNARIELSLLEGSLKSLEGQWTFIDLRDGRCKVALNLELHLHDGMIYRLYNRLLDTLADTMMERFVDRAYYIYGYEPGDDY
jgi:ribosome-associated toxin RatA of RatAB toxin-antitoxin module